MEMMKNMKAKVCLLGEGSVGKTSIIGRYVENTFSENYLPTIGIRTSKKNVIVNSPESQQDINLDFIIWDIMGQVSFRKILHPAYLRGAKAAVMVCDLTRRETYENLDYWIHSLLEEWQLVPMIFVANKSDLNDSFEIKTRELVSLASSYDSPFFTTSAKSGNNIEDMFKTLGKEIIKDSEETNKSLFNYQIGNMAE